MGNPIEKAIKQTLKEAIIDLFDDDELPDSCLWLADELDALRRQEIAKFKTHLSEKGFKWWYPQAKLIFLGFAIELIRDLDLDDCD